MLESIGGLFMRVVCIDDEQISLQYLQIQLEKVSYVEVIAMFTNPYEGKHFILNEEVDVVFLDIQMPEINGIQLAEILLEKKPNLIIVFVTAYEMFAIDAFQLNALDYVVKPINADRLQQTIKRIEKQLRQQVNDTLSPQQLLRIKVAPFLAFEIEPDVFEPIEWRTKKSQELFLYLLQNNNELIEKSSLIEILWSDYDLGSVYDLLYTTIYNVRKHLRPFNEHIILKNCADGYILELKQVEIDLIKWEEVLDTLGNVDESTVALYENTMQLNRGMYLANNDYIWLEGERYRLERLWVHTAAQIAFYYMNVGKLTEAMKWYDDIIERHPTMEEAHFNLMKLYEANGDFYVNDAAI